MHRLLTTMAAVLTLGAVQPCFGGIALYGGLGGHAISAGPVASANDGSLVTIDQTAGTTTLVGHPDNVARLTGIAFDQAGDLFGSTLGSIPFPPPPSMTTSTLIRIDPATGAELASIGPITAGVGGPAISIADLAIQPGTNTLFGIRGPTDGLNGSGLLYTIDKSTGVATLVGDTGHFFGSIAFATNGTLYDASADSPPGGGPAINPALRTINPATAQVLTTVSTTDFFGALAVRPTDGVIFAGTGDQAQLFTVNPATGAQTALSGTTGLDFVGDMDFVQTTTAIPVPPAAWMALATLPLAGAFLWRSRSQRT